MPSSTWDGFVASTTVPGLVALTCFLFCLCAWYVVDAPMVAVWLRYDVLLCVICGWAGIYIQFTIKVSSRYPGLDAATGDSAGAHPTMLLRCS